MIGFKKVNYMLLLLASPFIIAGCGGSTGDNAKDEESNADVAAYIQVPTTAQEAEVKDQETNTQIINNTKTFEEIGVGLTDKNSNETGTINASRQLSASSTSCQVKEDAEDGTTNGWIVYDSNPSGASVSNVYDSDKGSKVIELSGQGLDNGYSLGWTWERDNSTNKTNWGTTASQTIKWNMKFSEDYMVYVRVSTRKGYRYLYYTPSDADYGVAEQYDAPHYIHHGLGANSKNGTWMTFTRDLSSDLKHFEPDNAITSVDGFFVRGSGKIDDICFVTEATENTNATVYEDAEDEKDSRWSVYDTSPTGATIQNVYDDELQSRVISVTGTQTQNGFILGEWEPSKGWQHTGSSAIRWSMKTSNYFCLYVSVITTEGHRYLYYTPNNTNNGIEEYDKPRYIHHGIGENSKDGSWRVFTRDLEQDLKDFEPNNNLISVNAFLIRGTAKLDDIMMIDGNPGGGDISTN